MPAASAEDDSNLLAVRTLQNNLDKVQDATDASDQEIEFLNSFLSNQLLQTLVETTDKLEPLPEDIIPEDQHALEYMEDVYNALGDTIDSNREARELDKILSNHHVKALLTAHDDIVDRNYEEIPEQPQKQVFEPAPVFDRSISDHQLRLVNITKSDTEPLGITVKIDDDGDLVIARILAGSMSDRLRLLHVGDTIKEVNNIPVFTPQQLMDIIRSAEGGIQLKIIQAFNEQHSSSQMYMKVHFNYNPMNDRLIPSKEAGLPFKDGDILEILNHDDPNWWQARIVDDETNHVGLIPSKNLEENRKAFVRSDMDYSKSSLLCGLKRKKKKKIKYSATRNKDWDAADLVLYEEVARMPPFQRKTLVLVGANGVGRRSLKERLIKYDPRRFAAAIPHTSRAPREGEIHDTSRAPREGEIHDTSQAPREGEIHGKGYYFSNRETMDAEFKDDLFLGYHTSRAPREGEIHGKGYYFSNRETMDAEIKDDKFLEYGEFNGNIYGTKLETVLETIQTGKMCVLDVNPTSLKVLKNLDFSPYIIFIAAPNTEALTVMYEEGRRKGVGRGIAGPGTIDFKQEEDFLRIIEESAQIEKVYKSYFDMTIVNDNFDDTFVEIRNEVNSLGTAEQWVPVNWVY